ncbi:MAG: ComEC/Rec2 family competence protein [Alphaproteobacteria bacterium]|nr:ComEC/Rec2 family competence protein [Alphaproteobacteria bacterium]
MESARRVDLGDTRSDEAHATITRRAPDQPDGRQVVLWIPVSIGCGVGLYFALPGEPSWTLSLLALVGAAVFAAVARRWPISRSGGYFALALVVGFVAADFRTAVVGAPVIAKRTGPVLVDGTVTMVEDKGRGGRITLIDLVSADISENAMPARVRVTLRSGVLPPPGARVQVRAILMPPPAPVAPGAFDFARQVWFKQIGGVGFALGPATRIGSDESGLAVRLAAFRKTLVTRIRSALPGPDGAIAAALMTGDRGAIPAADLTALRDSGLAHLLAISGLHVGLVAGLIFFAVRLFLAAIPPIALRWPIKKWSALAALAAAFAYLWLTGATIPTQRAFVMTAIVLGAIVVDRRAVSMRLVAIAATIVLLTRPESLLGASFQMSFSAVIALIAAYEAAAPTFAQWRQRSGWIDRVLLYLAGVSFTTIIAGFATMPFAAYHFNQIALYGLAANALAVPITALWIMPAALVAYLLLPMGLEGLALVPMGWGIDAVRSVAHTVAGWPGATLSVPSGPPWGLALIVSGGLWLCLARGRTRFLGLVVIAIGAAAPLTLTPPLILADGQGRYVAVRLGDGYSVSRTARSFTAKMWLRRAGQATAPRWPKAGETSADGRLSCGATGCFLDTDAGRVLISDDAETIAQYCDEVMLVVSREPVRQRCAARVIDRFDVWRHGAHAVWIKNGRPIVRTAHEARGARPWVETTPRQRPWRP